MHSVSQRPARSPRALLVALASAAAWVTHCDYSDYPLEPTFCDDWCRVLLRADCGQEPENCVRTCERSLGPAQCKPLHLELLACYEATPASEFVCTGQGFQTQTRPEEWVCPAERERLIECAYPEVELCLDVCRAIEASQPSDAGADAATPSGQICPSYDIPCDSICWVANRYLERSDAGAGATNDASIGASDAGTLGELAPKLIECALERADECRNGTVGDAEPDPTWSAVLLHCAEELGF